MSMETVCVSPDSSSTWAKPRDLRRALHRRARHRRVRLHGLDAVDAAGVGHVDVDPQRFGGRERRRRERRVVQRERRVAPTEPERVRGRGALVLEVAVALEVAVGDRQVDVVEGPRITVLSPRLDADERAPRGFYLSDAAPLAARLRRQRRLGVRAHRAARRARRRLRRARHAAPLRARDAPTATADVRAHTLAPMRVDPWTPRALALALSVAACGGPPETRSTMPDPTPSPAPRSGVLFTYRDGTEDRARAVARRRTAHRERDRRGRADAAGARRLRERRGPRGGRRPRRRAHARRRRGRAREPALGGLRPARRAGRGAAPRVDPEPGRDGGRGAVAHGARRRRSRPSRSRWRRGSWWRSTSTRGAR